VADWTTISTLATAGGTLILAAATFSSVRSANRSARATERALLAGIRPVLAPSRFEDPTEKVGFMDEHWLKVPGGGAAAEVAEEAIYLAIGLRNVGNGLAVLDRWDFYPDRPTVGDEPRPIEEFQRLTRDLYIPAGGTGFWQGAFRDPTAPAFNKANEAIAARRAMTVDLLYGDHEGGQRTISRFGLLPRQESGYIASLARHWNIDRGDPR
jgi:hypothetical protein